jgi:hypothetical protein
MHAIRIRKRVDSDTLHLPELKQMLGKMVEIVIVEETRTPSEPPQGTACLGALLPKATFDPQALEAMRSHLTREQYEALSAIASQDLLDVDAIAELRAASMI